VSIENCYNFRRISDALTTSGVVGARRLGELAAQDYEAVIDLLPADNPHAVADERGIVERQGLDYIHIPVDFARPALAKFQAFCDAMERVQGRKVHIHCAANYRVSAFYSLYAVAAGIWAETQGRDFVADLWNPQDYPAWSAFISEVREITSG
jgi:protein tyrosine phosphatase (PTP) superfamily phosphohydrolase (DUF442 family)